MNTNSDRFNQDSAAASIDLMPYINALIDARWWLLAAAILGGSLAGTWAYSVPYMYESSAKVSVVDIDDPGGVSPDDRRASEVLTLVEHGFVMGTTRDNYKEVILARLRSRAFTCALWMSRIYIAIFIPRNGSQRRSNGRMGSFLVVGRPLQDFEMRFVQ